MKQLTNNLTRFGLLEVIAGIAITVILFVAALALGIGDSTTDTAAAPAPVEVITSSEPMPTELVDQAVLDNLLAAGHEVDYDGSTGAWTIDGEVVGWSEAEDEDFRAVAMLPVIRDAQP